jgi:hypothetical protein
MGNREKSGQPEAVTDFQNLLHSVTTKKRSIIVFDRAIEEYVKPLLLQSSFKRAKSAFFYKWNGNACWRIWPFLRQTKGVDEAFLHMTVCVGFKHLNEFLKRWPDAPFNIDTETPCDMTADVIYLGPTIQAPQCITADSDSDRLGIFMWQDIQNYALPFFQRFGTFKQSVAAWEGGKFYNAKPVGTYLLAAAHFLEGDKAKAFDVVQRQIASEELQARSGRAPLGELNSGEMDLVSRMGLEFDKMAAQELTLLKSFLKFLSEEEV